MGLIWTTNRLYTAPAAASGVSVTPSGTAWAYSGWTELIASAPADLVLAGVVAVPPAIDDVDAEFQIGTGAAGGETGIATWAMRTAQLFSLGSIVTRSDVLSPVLVDNVASGARLAVRLRKSGTSTSAWLASVLYYQKPITGSLQTTARALRREPAGAASVSVSVPASWTNSAWVQVLGAAPTDLLLLAVICDLNENGPSWELDVGVGAAGAEVVVTTFRDQNTNADVGFPNVRPLPTPLSAIPSGSRVAVRARKSSTDSYTLKAALWVVEAPL